MLMERSFIFRPTRAKKDWHLPPPEIRAQDVMLDLRRRLRIHAWWCPPENWTPEAGALLYCHGNAGNLSHRSERIREWQQELGVAVMIFDYPGYGKSTGKPTEKGCYLAGEAAWNWVVERQQVSPERLIILGGSLGGGTAVELAHRHPYRLLLVMSSFTSVPDVAAKKFPWLPVRPLLRNRFESQRKIGACCGPVFISHGTQDSVIPFEMGRQLYDAAREPKHFHVLEGYDHADPAGEDYYQEVKRFLAEVEARTTL